MPNDKKIRVLVVDDSVFMRKLITDLLHSDDELEVIGEAMNGIEAIKLNESLMPDVITMDINMPEMDGSLATKTILQGKSPRPAIIILSAFTEDGVKDTLEGLRLGAIDFVSKPSGEVSFDINEIRAELIAKIKVAYTAREKKHYDTDYGQTPRNTKTYIHPEAIVIGASTGGPSLVEKIITSLPSALRSTVFVVQHMPEKFSSNYVLLLNKNSKIAVKEAEEGEIIAQGVCYVAGGGHHLVIENFQEDKKEMHKIAHYNKEPKVSGYRPSIDVLMKTVAEKYQGNTLGIILTGMGSDGTNGMKAISDAGGYTIVQTPETAIIDSMPLSAIKKVGPDEILAPNVIINRIIELCS